MAIRICSESFLMAAFSVRICKTNWNWT